jgi:hypothetical protein
MRIQLKRNIYDKEDIIKFGNKHKFEKVKDVLEEDPQYLVWCHENERINFELSPKLYKKAVVRMGKRKRNYSSYTNGPHEDWMPSEEEMLGHFPGDA